ncbi:DUF3306 domain-containing protein [Belnapia sp. F-4-1]|uniref:DUF3306 domain-containing protein n=1 Tax=Belnapia sp. F-4-1 TaxID=1545443 RepID=UPI000691B393|nr:DUF3306 domain-containing protein [Belnapia sp. F-4-1]
MSEEGFLSRWSRRKREALRGPPEPQPQAEAPPVAPPAEAPPPAFDPDSLPPVESLTEASDITAFLRAEVPAALRRAALRRAWTLDPAIRDFTGPADYAWDYNAPDGVPGFAHALGGDVKRLLAQAIGALEEVAASKPDEAPPADTPPEPTPLEPASSELAMSGPVPPEIAEPVPEPPLLATEAAPSPEAPPAPPPRRRHGSALPV